MENHEISSGYMEIYVLRFNCPKASPKNRELYGKASLELFFEELININFIQGFLIMVVVIFISLFFKAYGWIFALVTIISLLIRKAFQMSKSVVETVSDSIKYPSENIEITGEIFRVLDSNYNFRVLEIISNENIKYQVGVTIKRVFKLGDRCHVTGMTLHDKKYENYVLSHNFQFLDTIEDMQTEATPVCPRCRRKMVLRNGQKGKFYGCSSFPKCRYTVSLKNKT